MVTTTWWKLRRRRRNISEELVEEKSQTIESRMRDTPVAESTNEERGELVRGPLPTTQERFQLTQLEQSILRLSTRGYRLTRSPGFQHLKKFVVFVIGCWLLGLFIRIYMFPHSQVFWFLKDCQLLEYYQSFSEFGFEQLDDLLGITDQDLIEIGVGVRAHRLRILARVQNKGHESHILIILLCSFLILQPLAASIFCACVIFHDGFKQKVKAALLWVIITLW